MIMCRHQAIGEDVGHRQQISLHSFQKIEIILLLKENLLPVVTAIVNMVINLRYEWRESARHAVDYTTSEVLKTSEVCYYTRYAFTAANPSPFGPMCAPITVVALIIRISRGSDWLTSDMIPFKNSRARASAPVCRIARRCSL